jgi:hypothetical protein
MAALVEATVEAAVNLTIRPLGTELLHISTDSEQQQSGPNGDVIGYPVGFTARMERPHESETPGRDW